ncbi:unnamed protein product, partial [Meganyctiphanes norvegica]
VFDGANDCGDFTDEKKQTHLLRPGCDSWEFDCDNGKCIPNESLCDVIEDCIDGTDEQEHLLPPVIINLHESTIYWGQGGDVTITCDLRCNSAPPTWYHNGSIINFN